jgi:hypothetical protein
MASKEFKRNKRRSERLRAAYSIELRSDRRDNTNVSPIGKIVDNVFIEHADSAIDGLNAMHDLIKQLKFNDMVIEGAIVRTKMRITGYSLEEISRLYTN